MSIEGGAGMEYTVQKLGTHKVDESNNNLLNKTPEEYDVLLNRLMN